MSAEPAISECCVTCQERSVDERARWKRAHGTEWVGDSFFRTFVVCSNCGNKRCPKATDHRLKCTGSNEPGQPGSVFRRVGG